MATGRRLRLRLFLDGVEVPVIGARIDIAEGAPAAATIQIVPTDRAMEIHPRTIVHLFALDLVDPGQAQQVGGMTPSSTSGSSSTGAAGGKTHDTGAVAGGERPEIGSGVESGEESEDTSGGRTRTKTPSWLENLDDYKLIFYGLHIAFAYTKDGYQRSFVLQCLDASIAWDTTYQFMLTYGPNGSGIMGSPARFVGANVNLFDDIINDPISVVSSLLQSTPKYHEFQKLSGLLAGLVSVCEAVGGVPGDFKGINDFNTVEELRNKVLHQIVTDEGDDTSTSLFSRKAFDQWLTNSAGGMGGLMSIRDILNMVMSYIYYGVVPNPAPYYRGSGQTATREETTSSSVVGDAVKADIEALLPEIWTMFNSLQTIVAAVNNAAGGVFVPDAGPTSEEKNEDETDSIVDDFVDHVTDPQSWLDAGSSISGPISAGLFDSTSGAGGSSGAGGTYVEIELPEAQIRTNVGIAAVGLYTQASPIGDAVEGTSAFEKVHAAIQYFAGSRDAAAVVQPLTAMLTQVGDLWLQAIYVLSEAAGLDVSSTTTVEFALEPRLGTQIFRPDIWFAAPPRCNVIFPEHHNFFSFNRQLLREVTRYNLRTSMELIGPDPLLDYYFYAPDLAGYVDLAGSSYWTESAIIMPHEVHTGIVPKMQHMGEISLYANDAQKSYYESQAGTDSDLKASYSQRVAHYNFFKFRFAPRTIQVSGEFNYLPVCGFPMAVMDKAFIPPSGVTPEEVLAAINEGKAESTLSLSGGRELVMPTQFLGLVSSIQHDVNQQGGRTTMVLNYCRAHRTLSGTDDEYLNVRLTEKKLEAGNIAEVTFLLTYENLVDSGNEEALKVLRNLTPQGVDVTDPVQVQGTTDGKEHDTGASAGGDRPEIGEVEPKEDGGGTLQVGSYGLQGTITEIKTDLTLVEDAEGNLYYGQVALTEAVEDLEGTISTVMPPEDAIRPPWVASLYGNKNIGEKIYEPFFGTGSIVDEQVFVSDAEAEAEGEADFAKTHDTGGTAVAGGSPVSTGAFGQGSAPSASEAEATNVYGELSGDVMDMASGANQESRVVVDPDNPLAALVTSVEAREDERPISVAMALDALSVVYGMTRTRGLSPEMFAWRYINRPVATLVDILGDRDFELDPETGNPLNADAREGFHSRGVAPLTELRGLLVDANGEAVDLADEDQAFQQVSGTGGKEPIAPSLDQRVERRSRVEAYVDELRFRALPG